VKFRKVVVLFYAIILAFSPNVKPDDHHLSNIFAPTPHPQKAPWPAWRPSCSDFIMDRPCWETDAQIDIAQGTKILKKAKSRLKILGAGRVTWSKFRTEDPQILGVTQRNLFPRNISRPDLGHTRFCHITRHAETSTQTELSCFHYVFTSRTLHKGSALTSRSSAQYRFFVHTCQNV